MSTAILGQDLLLNASGFLDVSGNDLKVGYSVAQAIAIAMRSVQGEWILDSSVGLPYFQQIFVKNPDTNLIRSVITDCLNSVPGVLSILALNVSINPQTRVSTISWVINTGNGPINGSSLLS